MQTLVKSLSRALLSLLLLAALSVTQPASAAESKTNFKLAWSIYVGWMPWDYAQQSGILKKWADKYGINIRVQRFDYAPSLDAFVGKNIDACAMTNMEATTASAKGNCK